LLPTEQSRHYSPEQLAGRAYPVVECGRHLLEDFGRADEQISGIEPERPCYFTLRL
jgi:hypothetical protein